MTSSSLPHAEVAPTATSRYEFRELLGRGGMASVYRATDRATGRDVALKQLSVAAGAPEYARVAALFEREFHTLAQLQHPHVIAVYDYGLTSDAQPYYTMELLDGGDLRDRAPVPWREACRLLFDVCSSLALLHSRRLLHRDISPRNVRCTQDGRAKLIDFGAMVPMSAGGADVVGTPAFTPPETVHRLAIDARTDLFSLGATLYHALTGRLPYSARTFAEAMSAWSFQVVPPSVLTPDVPPALDDLVLALISVEPKLRPQRAFDVMQRLAAIAGIEARESDAVSRAYLATPTLVGREGALRKVREQLLATRLSRGAGLLISGQRGLGRSRLLDSCALEAKTLGFTVLRAAASGKRDAFAAMHGLTQHLLDTWPDHTLEREFPALFTQRSAAEPANDSALESPARVALKDFSDTGLEHASLQDALCKLFLSASRSQPLMLAVDDVHRIDPPSAAVLLALIDRARRGRIFSALTIDSEADAHDTRSAFERRCQTLALTALKRDETEQLLGSLFGDVEHLAMLANEIHKIAAGNPQQSLDLCQHLIDHGSIRYTAGTWALPSRLSGDALPRTETEAMRARIAQLSPNASYLAEAQALAYYETFTDREYRALLPAQSPAEIERALLELQQAQVIVCDETVYSLANRLWNTALTAQLDAEATRARHAALADLYATSVIIADVYHSFLAGLAKRGLEALMRNHELMAKERSHARVLEQNVSKMIWCFEPALQTAEQIGYSAREIHELRRFHFGGIINVEDCLAPESRHAWLAQLIHDSGLDLYRADTQTTDTAERLTRALQNAYARHLATPEAERVYTIEEAIRRLAEYVVFAIGVGGRGLDTQLVNDLPELLAPFAPLSKALDAILNNAIAMRSCHCEARLESAHERWLSVLETLDTLTEADMEHIEPIRNALAYALGMLEAQMGLPSAVRWAQRLDRNPYQKVGALHLRKIIRMQEGDFQGAEKLRRQAEVLSLQMQLPPMFRALLTAELIACAKARDLDGVRQVRENMQPLAACYPGWQPQLLLAEGFFHAVRSDHESACAKFEQCIALTLPSAAGLSLNMQARVTAHAGLAESLLALDQAERARVVAGEALRFCIELDVGSIAFDVVRVLALAEAKLGLAGAVARLHALITEQERRGVSGMQLGLCYEARAQIALWQGDTDGFAQYAELTGRAYRHGAHGPLAARYETLMNQAQRHGFRPGAALVDFKTSTGFDTAALRTYDLESILSRSMTGTQLAQERADTALGLVCTACGASAGHLYLVWSDGLALRASHGAYSQSPSLEEVQSFLAREQARAEALTEMETGEIVEEAPAFTLIESSGTTYQLVQLSCLVDRVSKVAGVVALSGQAGKAQDPRFAQLLSALAAHLIRAGDTPGILRPQ